MKAKKYAQSKKGLVHSKAMESKLLSAKNNTRLEYIKRINYVLDFLEKNLDEEVSLKTLSEKAYYSSFHFHRIFSAIVGENLNELINRKRLERIAAILLVGSEKPIKELAYSYGFTSESSFSRAFKKFYGITPTQFKTEGKQQLSKIGIARLTMEKYIRSLEDVKEWLHMNAQIEVKELAAIQLAGIAHIGGFEEMGNMYQRLMEWAGQKGLLGSPNFKAITLYHDNPNNTEPSKLRFSACITVDQAIQADGAIRPIEIAKGAYAIGRFEILGQDFPKAWDSMCVWVLEQGFQFKDGDYFEMYHNDHNSHPEQKFIVDLCIPIESDKALKKVSITPKEQNLCIVSEPNAQSGTKANYHELIQSMKELRRYFQQAYESEFVLGQVYQGNKDFSYFSLSSHELKKDKLKFVIILDHVRTRFRICLSGQNKAVRKKYWKLFKDSDWNKYQLVTSIDDSLYIMDHAILEKPDFNNMESLCAHIETESLKFMKELRDVLELS